MAGAHDLSAPSSGSVTFGASDSGHSSTGLFAALAIANGSDGIGGGDASSAGLGMAVIPRANVPRVGSSSVNPPPPRSIIPSPATDGLPDRSGAVCSKSLSPRNFSPYQEALRTAPPARLELPPIQSTPPQASSRGPVLSIEQVYEMKWDKVSLLSERRVDRSDPPHSSRSDPCVPTSSSIPSAPRAESSISGYSKLVRSPRGNHSKVYSRCRRAAREYSIVSWHL